MQISESTLDSTSATVLTFAADAAFIPIGVVTVLLGPLLPTLLIRWSLDYSQAGALFPTQFWSSTLGVMVSGWMVSRFGFRFAMKAGLVLIAVSVAALLSGTRTLGMICVGGYGAGLGLSVPAANLLVAEVNAARRSAALNTLNFCWSVGAVACPFLVATAAKGHGINLFLMLVAAASLLMAIFIAAMPKSIEEPAQAAVGDKSAAIPWGRASLLVLAALFFIYVGTENAFGGWVASYAKSLGSLTAATAVITPSFFYASLTVGRLFAPALLRRVNEIRLAQAGILIACAGMAGLLFSDALAGVAVSACLAGIGLSSVYPITISRMSQEFGAKASRVGSVMFTMANLGGGVLPWMVGVSSGQTGSLKAGLGVPLAGSVAMFGLYLWKWAPPSANSGQI